MRFLVIGLVFVFGFQVTNAQTVRGSVSEIAGALPGALITNVSSKIVTVADANGKFEIIGLSGDTLITKFAGYRSDTVRYHSGDFVSIVLQPKSISLSEVIISGTRLSPWQQYQKNQSDFKDIYRRGDNKHMLSALGGPGKAGIGLSIDALYSTFSKEGRDARHLQRVLHNDYQNNSVDSKFTAALVQRVTGYKGTELTDFMIKNRPTYEFVQQSSDYDLIQFIQRKAKGVSLASDNPVTKKTEAGGFKLKFKMPEISADDNHPKTARFLPIHP